MSKCPHCGQDTKAEQPEAAGSLAAGSQLYRQRNQGARILPGRDTTSDNVTFGAQPDSAA